MLMLGQYFSSYKLHVSEYLPALGELNEAVRLALELGIDEANYYLMYLSSIHLCPTC